MKLAHLRKDEKGFTLVELIVVLVILALLAAILVPTLVGYIDKARTEKDFQTAQTVRVAAQAVEADIYASTPVPGNSSLSMRGYSADDEVIKLAGASSEVKGYCFTFDSTGKIMESAKNNYVIIGSSTYYWYDSAWHTE